MSQRHRSLLPGLLGLLLVAGCAGGGGGGPASSEDFLDTETGSTEAPEKDNSYRYPTWPYAGILVLSQYPYDLPQGRALGGQFLVSGPLGEVAYAEATLPRYVVVLPFLSSRRTVLLDLGEGTAVENLGFPAQDRLLLVASAYSGVIDGGVRLSRALLEIETHTYSLLSATPLARDAASAGMAMDGRRPRVFLYEVDEAGYGAVRSVDLLNGFVLASRPVGGVPVSVARKGLAVDRDGRYVFALVGGTTGGEFLPADEEAEPPALAVFSSDSLQVVTRVDLPGAFAPVAVVARPERSAVVVLTVGRDGSRLFEVDTGFHTVVSVVDLPGRVTDVALAEMYAVCPSDYGLYVVDLQARSFTTRPGLPFRDTGEMTISPDATRGLVRFGLAERIGGPGIGVVDLVSGQVLEVWN